MFEQEEAKNFWQSSRSIVCIPTFVAWQHRIYTLGVAVYDWTIIHPITPYLVSPLCIWGTPKKKLTTPISRWKLPSVATHRALTQYNYLRNAIRRRSSTRRKLKGAVERAVSGFLRKDNNLQSGPNGRWIEEEEELTTQRGNPLRLDLNWGLKL